MAETKERSRKHSAGVHSRRRERRGGGVAVRAGDRTRNARVPGREGARGARRAAEAAERGPRGHQPGPRDADDTRSSAAARPTSRRGRGRTRERVRRLFLGVIAAATLVTPIVQVGVLVAAGCWRGASQRLADRRSSGSQADFRAPRTRSGATRRAPHRSRPPRSSAPTGCLPMSPAGPWSTGSIRSNTPCWRRPGRRGLTERIQGRNGGHPEPSGRPPWERSRGDDEDALFNPRPAEPRSLRTVRSSA